MERLLQYMDDIDDLIGVVGLVYERLRRLLMTILALLVFTVFTGAGIVLAAWHPPIALATCLLLVVVLLYRAVTAPVGGPLQSI
jgi:CHASE2 domain-containing sensor protein